MLLEELSRHPDSILLRRGAHHVIKELSAEIKLPVMNELLKNLDNIKYESALMLTIHRAKVALNNYRE
jgi:hypothetical protein